VFIPFTGFLKSLREPAVEIAIEERQLNCTWNRDSVLVFFADFIRQKDVSENISSTRRDFYAKYRARSATAASFL